MTPERLREIRERAEKALDMIREGARTGWRTFRMSVPARPNEDSDLVLAQVTCDVKHLASELERRDLVIKQLVEALRREHGECDGCQISQLIAYAEALTQEAAQ